MKRKVLSLLTVALLFSGMGYQAVASMEIEDGRKHKKCRCDMKCKNAGSCCLPQVEIM